MYPIIYPKIMLCMGNPYLLIENEPKGKRLVIWNSVQNSSWIFFFEWQLKIYRAHPTHSERKQGIGELVKLW